MSEINSTANLEAQSSQEGPRITNRVISLAKVMSRTELSRSTIYAWMKAGLFPRQRKLGPRRVGWLESDIEAWIAQREVA